MKKVLLGLSGGVDSAVSCYLLKKAGYDVTACFMRNWDALAAGDYLGNPTINDSQCPQEVDYEDAKKVAKKLNVKLLRVDFIKEYWDEVFSYLIREYENGRTPNPDIFCNKYIKFDAFLSYALKNGFDLIAMGHYAKRVDKNGLSYLLKAHDKNKDQTYFLSQLSQRQLSYALFPLGDIDKSEVRKIANELNLDIANKKDSTGICFIGERHFKEFLKNYIPSKRGKIIDINTNKFIKEHDGVMYYTIGQRKGLGIGGISGEISDSYFVCKKDIKNNILYVAKGDENEFLYADKCIVKEINYISGIIEDGKHINVKFRYRQNDNGVTFKYIDEKSCELIFDKPHKAMTPGQAAVFYDGDVCLGGGLIDMTFYKGKRIDI